MTITDSATNAIIHVMKSKGLDLNKTYLEIGVCENNLGISFTREKAGKLLQFGELYVIVSDKVDATKLVIDFGEVNGRKGLVFLEGK